MTTFTGKGGISAKIIADSTTSGVRIITYELEYPRFVHSEFLTHRLLSKNAASSRAIPVPKMIELIQSNTAMPIHWGKNQPGMSAKEECDSLISYFVPEAYIEGYQLDERISSGWDKVLGNKLHPDCEMLLSKNLSHKEDTWLAARNFAISYAKAFHDAGYHKQIVNRLLEPFTFIKVVCTATEYDNFFWLRKHPDAQPEIQELARCMWEARKLSSTIELRAGEWHTPYFGNGFWSPHDEVSLADALAVSSSCCAQVSYRRLDDTLEKARDIFNRLVESKPVHASPFEHQATPMTRVGWERGVTHQKQDQSKWSGNFKGWIQHRQLIEDNACWEYKED